MQNNFFLLSIFFSFIINLIFSGKITPYGTPILASVSNLEEISNYTFSFIPETAIPSNSSVEITFPQSFISLLGIPLDTTSFCNSNCSISDRTVIFYITNAITANTTSHFSVYQVKNPLSKGETGNFKIITKNGISVLDENLNFGSIEIGGTVLNSTAKTVNTNDIKMKFWFIENNEIKYKFFSLSIVPCNRYSKIFNDELQKINNPSNTYYGSFLNCYLKIIANIDDFYHNYGLEIFKFNRNMHSIKSSVKIPLKIHYIFLFNNKIEMPKAYCEVIVKNFKNIPDYEYIIWTTDEEKLKSNNKDCFPEEIRVFNIYKNLDVPQQNKILLKAIETFLNVNAIIGAVEIAKALILERLGGISMSAGIELKNTPKKFHYIFDFYAGTHEDLGGLISGSFVAAKPHHPILQGSIDILRDTFQTKYIQNEKVSYSDIGETIFQLTVTVSFVLFGNVNVNDDYLLPTGYLKNYNGCKNEKIMIQAHGNVLELYPIGQVLFWAYRPGYEDNSNKYVRDFYFNDFIDLINLIHNNNTIFSKYEPPFEMRQKKNYSQEILFIILMILCIGIGVFILIKKKYIGNQFKINSNEISEMIILEENKK